MISRQKAIRYQGSIAVWKDDRGFGFIAPNGGGPLIFVHIRSFASDATRPAANAVVTYEMTVNDKGQRQADNVAFVRGRVLPTPSNRYKNISTLVAPVGFLGLVATLVLLKELPAVVFGVYVGISALAFIAYAADKSAARNNRWRVSERMLHVLGLAGGWPGALIARQVYRHKTKKHTFQIALWFTVIVNCATLGWLLSSDGANLLLTILGSPRFSK